MNEKKMLMDESFPLTVNESRRLVDEQSKARVSPPVEGVRLGLLRRDFDEAIPFPGVRIPPGGEIALSLTPKRSCFPKRLYIPTEMADRMEVTNIIVVNKGEEIPFFDGMKVVSPEHPEGGPRRKPYGILPRILHDGGEKIVLRVRNPHPVDRPFTAVLALEYPFPEPAKDE